MTVKNILISALARILDQAGLHISRAYRVPQTTLNLLELCVPALLFKQPSVFFVQIGASDGVTDDPIFPLIKKYKLTGVCVEPLPIAFEKLKSNYQGISGIRFENAALTNRNGEIFLYCPISQNHSILDSQKASSKENVLLGHGFGKGQIEKVAVQGITFSALIRKHIAILCRVNYLAKISRATCPVRKSELQT